MKDKISNIVAVLSLITLIGVFIYVSSSLGLKSGNSSITEVITVSLMYFILLPTIITGKIFEIIGYIPEDDQIILRTSMIFYIPLIILFVILIRYHKRKQKITKSNNKNKGGNNEKI